MSPEEHAKWLESATLQEVCNQVIWEELMGGTAHCGWTDRARAGLVEQVQSGIKWALERKLHAENAELKAALEKIANHRITSSDKGYLLIQCEGYRIAAEEALKKVGV